MNERKQNRCPQYICELWYIKRLYILLFGDNKVLTYDVELGRQGCITFLYAFVFRFYHPKFQIIPSVPAK